MRLTDFVRTIERAKLALRRGTGEFLKVLELDDPDWDKPLFSAKGWVDLVLRERGKIVPGSHRSGHNIWTNSGREYLALVTSLKTVSPRVTFRSDAHAYIGVGTGSFVEDVGVTALAQPVIYTPGQFLAALDVPPTFPLTPTQTTAQYHRTFAENEITTTSPSQVNISEMGLFTDGSPSASPAYEPGTRDTTIANAALQAPNAYKSFEPVGKLDTLQLDVSWQIRY